MILDNSNTDSGIHASSQGENYPIIEYQIGDSVYCSSYGGVELYSGTILEREQNTQKLLKCLRIADRAWKALVKSCEFADGSNIPTSGGFSIPFDENTESPTSGYMVSMELHEQIVPMKSKFGNYLAELHSDIFRKCVESIGFIEYPVANTCLGGWVYEGNLYLDLSVNFSNRQLASINAIVGGQLAYYDIVAGKSINCTEEIT